jgi:acyl-[acyl-carrier-protein] desaturase
LKAIHSPEDSLMVYMAVCEPAHRNLFNDFATVAESIGVYTAHDYVDIMEHLIERWDVAHLTGLNAEGIEAQEYVCTLPARFRKLAERKEAKFARAGSRSERVTFSWLFDRSLPVPTL